LLDKKIGIDLGTSTVLIYVKGEGIVINEPSLVAVNRDGRTQASRRWLRTIRRPRSCAAPAWPWSIFEVLKRNQSYLR